MVVRALMPKLTRVHVCVCVRVCVCLLVLVLVLVRLCVRLCVRALSDDGLSLLKYQQNITAVNKWKVLHLLTDGNHHGPPQCLHAATASVFCRARLHP